MNPSIENLLILHSLITGLFLVLIGISLHKKGLFTWTSAGFWAWTAFFLYFVLNPVLSVIEGEYSDYLIRLEIAGGTARGLWILFVILTGMALFFTVYVKTNFKPVTWNLYPQPGWITPLQVLWLLPFIALGTYSLINYRANISVIDQVVIEGGRFTGDTTAYEYQGHIVLLVPIMMALLSSLKIQRVLGWAGAVLFVFLASPNSWARFVIVSCLIGVSLIDTLRRSAAWPRLLLLMVVFMVAAVLQVRGHANWSLNKISSEISSIATEIPDKLTNLASSQDSAMLATFYLESYVKDEITGYDFELPLLNYALFGVIPSRFFSDKYFIVDWLKDIQPSISSPTINELLFGSKSSLFGGFYTNGGIIGVAIGAILAGFLSRRLDGFLAEDNSIVVRSVGVAWMSTLWMVWGSNEVWGLSLLGFMLFPAIPLWLFGPKQQKKFVLSTSTYIFG